MSKVIFNIAYVPGDDAGPEAMDATLRVLEHVEILYPKIKFNFIHADIGYARYQKTKEKVEAFGMVFGGVCEETMESIKNTDAMLYTAVANSKIASRDIRGPWMYLRKYFDCYANIRPGKSYPNSGALLDNIDVVLVRDQSEGLGPAPEFKINDDVSCAVISISKSASERIARIAFDIAKNRKQKKVSCIHKNSMAPLIYGNFEDACREVSLEYPDVEYGEIHTDYLPYALIKSPQDIDVIITKNFYGDLISGEISAIIGSFGMAPAAIYGDNYAIFKPSHGSAPDIAGKNLINPSATILSAKMMLEWFGQKYDNSDCLNAASRIENAIYDQLKEGKTLTVDLIDGRASTTEFTDELINRIHSRDL